MYTKCISLCISYCIQKNLWGQTNTYTSLICKLTFQFAKIWKNFITYFWKYCKKFFFFSLETQFLLFPYLYLQRYLVLDYIYVLRLSYTLHILVKGTVSSFHQLIILMELDCFGDHVAIANSGPQILKD